MQKKRRYNFRLSESLVAKAQEALGAPTLTETVEQALRLSIQNAEAKTPQPTIHAECSNDRVTVVSDQDLSETEQRRIAENVFNFGPPQYLTLE